VIVVTQSSTYVSCEEHVHQLLQQLCMYFKSAQMIRVQITQQN